MNDKLEQGWFKRQVDDATATIELLGGLDVYSQVEHAKKREEALRALREENKRLRQGLESAKLKCNSLRGCYEHQPYTTKTDMIEEILDKTLQALADENRQDKGK